MAQSYILRAKFYNDKNIYRDIKINSNASLMKLAEAIIPAFDFEFDHMCGFYETLGDPGLDKGKAYTMFADDPETMMESPEDLSMTKHKLTDLWRKPKDTWQMVFDYGEGWRFLVELIKVEDEAAKKPAVIKSVGEAPEQYPDYEGDDFDDENGCECPICEEERCDEELGVNQPRFMNQDETMVAITLVLRYQGKMLLGVPNVPEADEYLWPMLPQTEVTLEDSVRHYCVKDFGIKPKSWIGLKPFTTIMTEGHVILCAPYIVELDTDKVKRHDMFKEYAWFTKDEIAEKYAGAIATPIMDYLFDEELMTETGTVEL